MKTNINAFVSLMAGFLTLSACAQKELNSVHQTDGPFKISVEVSNPQFSSGTRTCIKVDGTNVVPYWLPGDKLSVTYANTENPEIYTLASNLSQMSSNATFEGTVGPISEPCILYSGYPAIHSFVLPKGNDPTIYMKMCLPAEQHPGTDTFDPASDMLAGMPVELIEKPSQPLSLQLKRASAIVRFVLHYNGKNTAIASSDLHSFVFNAGAFTGKDGKRYPQKITGIAKIAPKKGICLDVVAEFSNAVKAVFDNEKSQLKDASVYLNIWPRQLAEGETVTVSGKISKGEFSKEIVLPELTDFQAGKITTIEVNLTDENFLTNSLPFTCDLLSYSKNAGAGDVKANLPQGFVEVRHASVTPKSRFKLSSPLVNGELEIGNEAYMKTQKLNLSFPFKVTVTGNKVAGAPALKVWIDENEAQTRPLTGKIGDVIFEFPAATNASSVTIQIVGTTPNQKDQAVYALLDYIKIEPML